MLGRRVNPLVDAEPALYLGAPRVVEAHDGDERYEADLGGRQRLAGRRRGRHGGRERRGRGRVVERDVGGRGAVAGV